MSGAIVAHIAAVNDAASAYRSIIAQTEGDLVMRGLMLDGLAFDCAKDTADAQTARRFGPVFWASATKASVALVVGDRMVFVVADVVTRTGRVMSDERTVAA